MSDRRQQITDWCDWLVRDAEFLEFIAAFWLKHSEASKRQEANSVVVKTLMAMGMSEDEAHCYQRGFAAGMDFTAAIYRPRMDA